MGVLFPVLCQILNDFYIFSMTYNNMLLDILHTVQFTCSAQSDSRNCPKAKLSSWCNLNSSCILRKVGTGTVKSYCVSPEEMDLLRNSFISSPDSEAGHYHVFDQVCLPFLFSFKTSLADSCILDTYEVIRHIIIYKPFTLLLMITELNKMLVH